MAVALGAYFFLCGAVWGQGVRSYEPASPTISPYLNLLRTDFGPLPNYHSLVRPQLRQQAFNREASREIEYNLRELSAVQQTPAAESSGGVIAVRQGQGRPPRVSSQFQYYSHYFPAPRAPRPRR